jgi:hypothetical protein
MHPTGIASSGTATRVAWLAHGVVRVGVALVVTLAGTSALIPAIGAESTTPELQQAGASNGGVASATTGGNVDIGQIITGENTGNAIATGDISGPAAIDGGEIDYPTDVTISQILGPPIATADGGDDGTASSSDDDSESDGANNGKNGEDVTIINRNDNQSNAKVVDTSRD